MKSSELLTSLPPVVTMPRWPLAFVLIPLLVSLDALLVFSSHTLAYQLRMHVFVPPTVLPPASIYFSLACFLALMTPLIFGFSGVYARHWRPLFTLFTRICLGMGLLACVQFTAIFFFRQALPHPDFTFSRLTFLLGVLLSLVSISLLHLLSRKLLQMGFRRGWGVRRVLLAGETQLLQSSAHFLLQGVAFVGHCRSEPQALLQALYQTQAELVLLRQQDLSSSQLASLFQQISRAGAELWLLPDAAQLSIARQKLAEMAGLPVLTLQRTPLNQPLNRALKRALDLSIALLGLVCLSPLLALLALAVKLDSPGPVLYQQERISRNGQRFKMFKFRTMQLDSEQASGPVWAQQQDPRTTRVGAWLRRASLDELPQLFNVLNGSMSFVGPRPERPHFVDRFEQEILDYPDRHLVKAGLTGWAQINGLRGDTSIEERTRYDLYYLENWSLLFDLRIIARSFVTVVQDFIQKRAY